MPLTEKGFQRMTYDEILNLQIDRAKLLFGEDIDTSDQSVFGKILRLYCLDAAENQELAEGVYLSAYPNTASGVNLDRLLPFAGITRNPATYAQHTIEVSGTIGTAIEMGFLVSAGDIVFHSVDSYAIGTDGKAVVTVECNESGVIGNVNIGSINAIVNPAAGIDSITHTAQTVVATDAESDYSVRLRFSQAFANSGSSTTDSLRGAILRVENVDSVLIEENATSTTSPNGLEPHTIRIFVYAPQTEEVKAAVANAIYSKKPIGIGMAGNVSVTVKDTGKQEHVMKWSWAQEVAIHVRCTITTNSAYSAEAMQEIKDNIVQKISAYAMGQDVTATSLYAPIYVDGVEDVTSLTISKDGDTFGTTAISISAHEIARVNPANIEVTLSE
jgi:uncharacterized phage protein gp47/JayE